MKNVKFLTWMIRTIKAYLENREFRIKIEKEHSTSRKIEAGIPQGSVLGPLLFNIYMMDIPKLQHCKIAQFAGNTAIYTHSRIASVTCRGLTEDLEKITRWFMEWKEALTQRIASLKSHL